MSWCHAARSITGRFPSSPAVPVHAAVVWVLPSCRARGVHIPPQIAWTGDPGSSRYTVSYPVSSRGRHAIVVGFPGSDGKLLRGTRVQLARSRAAGVDPYKLDSVRMTA
jgi:hypothetical protein